MSRKLWVARICAAFAAFVLFMLSSYAYWWYRTLLMYTFLRRWEFFGLSILLQILAGVLLGASPEVFFNLRTVQFSPIKFVVLAIIPIVVLVYIIGYSGGYWGVSPDLLPPYITSYIFETQFGLVTSCAWIGVAIGKALYIRQ